MYIRCYYALHIASHLGIARTTHLHHCLLPRTPTLPLLPHRSYCHFGPSFVYVTLRTFRLRSLHTCVGCYVPLDTFLLYLTFTFVHLLLRCSFADVLPHHYTTPLPRYSPHTVVPSPFIVDLILHYTRSLLMLLFDPLYSHLMAYLPVCTTGLFTIYVRYVLRYYHVYVDSTFLIPHRSLSLLRYTHDSVVRLPFGCSPR